MTISFWGIIWTLLIGVVFGVLGRLLLPGKQNISFLVTVLAGVVAVVVGLFISEALGVATTNGVDWIELLIKIVLAVIFVGLAARFFSKGNAPA
ncbi:GlsB/YeaQ/YmgE family stress response membrane protein [Pseudonocardia sp.]|uniref:GlsB/YeaQ/YmgE family stress response membrane protein n=1 Tax=Pseudonocardia sp. TaxID=60912 RepID=UPI003D1399C6